MSQPLTTWYLEMHAPSELQAARRHPDLQIMECEYTQFEVDRFMYSFVGGPWQWTGKLHWSDAQWKEHAEDPKLRVWVHTCTLDHAAALSHYQARGFRLYREETTG